MENHQNHKAEGGEEEPNTEKNQHRQQVWGTWEELLLACAVNRHGFKDWDAVAMEVQSRGLLATARHCEQRFCDICRRFNDGAPPPQQNGASVSAGDDSDPVPWLEELRKLRVAELRREVQRRDVSILSLQLEVKRLEEEKARENDGKDDEKPDLAVSGELRPENDKTGEEVAEAGPANFEPEERTDNADKSLPTTDNESDRENQSVNESNSTGSRFEKTGEVEAKTGSGPGPVQSGSKEPNPVARKPAEEESNNGSYDALAKVPTCESLPPSEERKVEEDDDSSELHDSIAHSGEGGTRESSEVQSSASLTRKMKTRWRKEVSGSDGRSGGVSSQPENDEAAMVKSEPFVSVLQLIKGHHHSSLFERRLESQQDSDRYKDLVKQPLDMETIQLRLQKDHYSTCTSAFFRDLLLLFTNAIVFFPHESTESQAARQLHDLVTAEMKNHDQAHSDPMSRKNDSLPPNTPLPKPDSLLSKNKASGPILVCRKRSSVSAKPSSATFGQKGDQPIFNEKKERPSSDAKPSIKPSCSDTDEEEVPKAKEKPVTGARSLRRSSNNKDLNNKKLSSNSTPKAGSSGNKPSETLKLEKSKAEAAPDKKRNAAADFLKRIKRNTSAEALKGGSGGGGSGGGGGSSSSSKGGGGGGNGAKDQKKVVNNGKGDKGKERASRHNVGGGSLSVDKRNKNVENNSQSKRSVGRPPKKAAETNAGGAKRGRESSASAGKDKRPKKRSKK